MRRVGAITLLLAMAAACAGCASAPAPQIPPAGPQPSRPSSPGMSIPTAPADFPSHENAKKVCKEVTTDQGSKRVCMWEPQHY